MNLFPLIFEKPRSPNMKLKMKFFFAAVLILCASVALLPAAEINWHYDWQDQLKDAATNNQPVLIDFFTDWCTYCKQLDKTTFVDPAMLAFFKKENYILIKINPEKDKTAEDQFKVYSYPTLVVFNAKGEEIDRILGYRNTADLTTELSNAQKGIGTLSHLLTQYQKTKGIADKTNFVIISAIMNKYIARADYPQALELVETILTLDPQNKHKQAAGAMFQRGYIYYKWKNYKKAVNALLEIHTRFPQTEEAKNGFHAAAYYAGKFKDKPLALNVMKQFIKTFPQDKDLADIQERIKKLEEELNQEAKK